MASSALSAHRRGPGLGKGSGQERGFLKPLPAPSKRVCRQLGGEGEGDGWAGPLGGLGRGA